nr:hypothetical protein Iba_chr12bCG17680 [Ipomoea batatas]
MPVRENLRARGVPIDGRCPLCNAAPETTMHLFCGSAIVNQFWSALGVVTEGSLLDLMDSYMGTAATVSAELVAACTWTIQNDVVWNAKSSNVEAMKRMTISFVDSWQQVELQRQLASLQVPEKHHKTRLASNWSDNVFSLAFSAFDLWILSISTLLFLKTFPLTFMYISWYMCLSIFFDSLYFRSKRLSTRILLIQRTFVGNLASLVPLRLPDHVHTKSMMEMSYGSYEIKLQERRNKLLVSNNFVKPPTIKLDCLTA